MGRKLYVGNLGFDVTNQELQDAFAAVGTIESVAVITERDAPRSALAQAARQTGD